MATSRRLPPRLALPSALLLCAAAIAREPASPSNCQTAAARPAIAAATASLVRHPDDLKATFVLADAWSDAGCFADALQVLQRAAPEHPANGELQTRLRVARSLVGEEHYFANLDRADDAARLKRNIFRCTTLYDAAACDDALRQRPDDATLRDARQDAVSRSSTADAATEVSPGQPQLTAVVNDPPRPTPDAARAVAAARYHNVEPAARSH